MILYTRLIKLLKVFLSWSHNPIALIRIGHLGKWLYVSKGLQVHSPQKIYLVDNVTIGRYSRLSTYQISNYLNNSPNEKRYPDFWIIIQNGCYIGNFFSVLAGAKVPIGENTLIASFVSIITENHSTDPECGVLYGTQDLNLKGSPVTISRCCRIGEKVIILSGVTIGEWSIIGARAVVTCNVPPYSLAVGNPAKVIRQYNFHTHEW